MSARFLVTLSSEMQSVAVGWQMYSITHQALDLGLAGLAQFLPGLCLFLPAGQLADRLPRKRILQACYAAFALCSALLLVSAIKGIHSAGPLYAVLLLNGTVRAFAGPAGQAVTPTLVPAEDFANAIAWNASIFQTATIAGPLLGGALYGLANRAAPVYGTALLATSLAWLLLTRVKMTSLVRKASSSAKLDLEGLRYIWRNKMVLGAMSLDLFAVLLGGAVALLPVFAQEILQGGAVGLGLLRSAPGLGAVIMSVAVARFPIHRRAGLAMFICVSLFGLFTILFGLSRSLPLSILVLLLSGAADTVSVIIRHTLVQMATPDAMRGRVSAVNMVFIGASNELGQFESGLTAHWFGTVPAVVLGGFGTIAVVLLWAAWFPALRKLDQLDPEILQTPGTAELDDEEAVREAGAVD